jgi:dolichol kinase
MDVCDAVTWTLGSATAAICHFSAHFDYTRDYCLLMLIGFSWLLTATNDRPKFRHGAGNGIVCGLLAVSSALLSIDSPLFATAVTHSLVLALVFLLSPSTVPTLDWKVCLLAYTAVVGALSYFLSLTWWIEGLSVAVGLFTLTALMVHAPSAFTLGEFLLVSTLSSLPLKVALTGDMIGRFAAVGAVAGIICLSLSLSLKQPVYVFMSVVPFLFVVFDILPIAKFILSHVVLICYCGVVCGVFIIISKFWQGLRRFPQIIQRKFFHLMALLVFVPPLVRGSGFLRLAICGAVFVFLAVESLRITRFPVVGSTIEAYVSGFIDDRDSGGLILTHLFLLLGLGLPVVLAPDKLHTVQSCGVAVLAVGDAMASIIGVNFGRHKWPGSKKSLEGTAGAFFGTWGCLVAIQQLIEVDLSWRTWARLAVLAAVGALDEAFTSQIDNLTLPFVMIPFVMLAKLLI